jgi:hypothetical protein
MPIETKTVEIGEYTYQIPQLPAMRGLKMLNRLGRLFGPALADLFGSADEVESIADLDVRFIGPAARDVFERLTEAEMESITRDLLAGTLVTIGPKTAPVMPIFDDHFAGKYQDVFQLLGAAIKGNFGGFFEGLAARLVGIAAQRSHTAESSTSPTSGQPTVSS